MAKKEPKTMSVITIPMKTEKWQEDRLFKKFKIGRIIYNTMLNFEMKKYEKVIADQRYIDAQEVIKKVSAIQDKNEKEKAKKSPEYKKAVEDKYTVLRENNMSKFDLTNDCTKFYKHFNENISSTIARLSIAVPMWEAFERVFFGNGKTVHYKKNEDFKSLASDGLSGIRVIDKDGNAVRHPGDNYDLYINFGGKGKKMTMPLKIDRKDYYLLEMLDRDIKIVRVVRRFENGKYRYYAQLTVTGQPAIKYTADGELKKPIGEGVVGIYVDTTTITICTKDGVKRISLNQDTSEHDEKKAELERKMDNLRRVANPDNFNEDGTVKKGRMVDGKRVKLQWNNSNHYKKVRDEKRSLETKNTTRRNIARHVLANEILTYGDKFYINNFSFQSAAKKKEETEHENDKKKKKGKEVHNNAPATILSYINQALAAKDKACMTKIDIGTPEIAPGYREHYAKELYELGCEAEAEKTA